MTTDDEILVTMSRDFDMNSVVLEEVELRVLASHHQTIAKTLTATDQLLKQLVYKNLLTSEQLNTVKVRLEYILISHKTSIKL